MQYDSAWGKYYHYICIGLVETKWMPQCRRAVCMMRNVDCCSLFWRWLWFDTRQSHTVITRILHGPSQSAGCSRCAPYFRCQALLSWSLSSTKAQYSRYTLCDNSRGCSLRVCYCCTCPHPYTSILQPLYTSANTPVKNWRILLEWSLLPACHYWWKLLHSDARVLLDDVMYTVFHTLSAYL